MELAQLKYFLTVAENEHMTQAAQHLNIAQPALSQSIHKLETELGVRLFARSGRNIHLTEDGKKFQRLLLPLASGFREAIDEISRCAEAQENTLTVCIKAASVMAVEAMSVFALENPDVAFKVTDNTDLPDNDVLIWSSASKPRGKKNAPMYSFTENIGIALPANDMRKDPIHLSDLAHERFICLAGSRHFRKLCDRRCLEHGFSYELAFESDDPSVVRKMIALGLGIGFWPERSWGALEGSGARLARIAEEGFNRTVTIELTEKGKGKSMGTAFFETLISLCNSGK